MCNTCPHSAPPPPPPPPGVYPQECPFCLRHLSMDLSWQPVTGAAQRRKGRRLRAAWRHEQQSIAQALAVFSHHSAPRRQETARAGGGARVEVHGGVPGDAPPQAAGAQYFSMDDDVVAPAAVRPAPLDEVRPQMGYKRHCGSGFELVLDVTVPQMGRELVEVPNVVSPVVEQNVHIPVRGGGRSKIPRGGVQGLRPGQGPPAPAVSHPPAPVVEYISHAPAVFPASAPVIEYFSPAPAVFPATAPVTFSPAPCFQRQRQRWSTFHPRQQCFRRLRQWWSSFHPCQPCFQRTAPVVEYFSPAPAVFPATAPVEEFISPVPAVSQATAPVVEVFLTRASRVPGVSASGGVFLTRASRVPGVSSSGGVFLTRASRVSCDSSSGGVFLTRASRASFEFNSGCWWRFSRLCPRTEFSSSRWSCCPWSASSGPHATFDCGALRAGRTPS